MNASTASPTVSQFATRNDTLKAETYWTLRTVTQHCSYKSNDDVSKLFPLMFPDSALARQFTCGERKSSYIAIFGIAEHFKQNLLKTIRGHYSVLFDESLNKGNQKKQMDIHVRYWDESKHVVHTRYLDSQFMGRASAADMVEHFESAVLGGQLNPSNLIQIGMDGPSVNWKFYELISEKLKKDFDTKLLNVGSCGLHILHNSFKSGAVASTWKVEGLLSSIYYLYKDSPARREDFTKICDGGKMPLKFCNHRWLENVPVAKRTIEIWPTLVQYVEEMESKKKSQKPTCNSYAVLKDFSKDKLVIAKLEFFKLVASALQGYLSFYQTDKPVLPMMAEDLSSILRSLLRRFVKPEVLAKMDSTEKLTKIDLSKDNLVHYKLVDVGILTEEALKKAPSLSERQVCDFRNEARDFLAATCRKMLDKCPLGYTFVRAISSLDPRAIHARIEECKTNFRQVVVMLQSLGKLNGEICDKVMDQYRTFVEDTDPQVFASYSKQNDRLDSFYHENLSSRHTELSEVVKMILVMSHGQADVERGFSINKEVEGANLTEKNIIAQRRICDYVSYCGGVTNVPITKELLASVASSRNRYQMYLDEERRQRLSAEESRKRKSTLDELEELKRVKKRIRTDIDQLVAKADTLAQKAEQRGQLSLITQSNCLRKRAKDKEQEIKIVEENISKVLNGLKS